MRRPTFPGTAVIPTRNRVRSLRSTFESLAGQSLQPRRVIVVDASDDDSTEQLCAEVTRAEGRWAEAGFELLWKRAKTRGAAAQRNQAVIDLIGDALLFMDDDILFEPGCVEEMWSAFESDPGIGAVSALITNEAPVPPGRMWRLLYRWLAGRPISSYAGRCFGPAVLQMPADDPALPKIVTIDWMPTGCALYRRTALPSPMFDSFFTGYSYMEDAALSLLVGKNWKLVNARTARLFHDSRPGDHKSDITALSTMEMINRHHVMTSILGLDRTGDLVRLSVFEFARVFSLGIDRRTRNKFWRALKGKFKALGRIRRERRRKDSTNG